MVAPRISIVMPAHNEASVIRRTLGAFVPDAEDGELEVVVVCNGCSDDTARIAAEFGPSVRVIETDVPSKANALNLGDAEAQVFPRIYMDADVVMSIDSIRKLADPLREGSGYLAAAPAVDTVFKSDAAPSVRSYYRFWMSLPFVQEGMMAAGVYAVSAEGRKRFEAFPKIISDDGFFRLHFAPHERIEVPDAVSQVHAPSKFMDLVRIKTRSRLGVSELQALYPELYGRELRTKGYCQALRSILSRPSLYPDAVPFALVTAITRYRAGKQRRAAHYTWERDHSSRS